MRDLVSKWERFVDHAARFGEDVRRVRAGAKRRGTGLALVSDPSLWALGLLRGASMLKAVSGRAWGLPVLLKVAFHIDVWSDDIGPGLRLPHPFGIVIGDGVKLGANCTVMHGVTLQRGATQIDDGVVLANNATVLAGAHVGQGSLVGAASVVRGQVPPRSVVAGAPARVIRPTRPGEAGA
ncbi:MAG: hypothetical protein KA712_15555 [Myxococcales bacterium]|nr:hypothetical protein [Myxococcales bacterium]